MQLASYVFVMLGKRRVAPIIVVKPRTDRIKQLATYSLMYMKKFDVKNGVLNRMNKLNMLNIKHKNQTDVTAYPAITFEI